MPPLTTRWQGFSEYYRHPANHHRPHPWMMLGALQHHRGHPTKRHRPHRKQLRLKMSQKCGHPANHHRPHLVGNFFPPRSECGHPANPDRPHLTPGQALGAQGGKSSCDGRVLIRAGKCAACRANESPARAVPSGAKLFRSSEEFSGGRDTISISVVGLTRQLARKRHGVLCRKPRLLSTPATLAGRFVSAQALPTSCARVSREEPASLQPGRLFE
jgi:hypothetical protein